MLKDVPTLKGRTNINIEFEHVITVCVHFINFYLINFLKRKTTTFHVAVFFKFITYNLIKLLTTFIVT
jgi:hypothetical protein